MAFYYKIIQLKDLKERVSDKPFYSLSTLNSFRWRE